jgi:DNA-directed RNA polymerase specialized sigma subunit
MTTITKIKEIPFDYLSVAETAAMRGVSAKTVYQWLQNGLAYATDRFGRFFILAADAKAFTPKAIGSPKGCKHKTNYAAMKKRRERKKRIAALRAKDMTIKAIAAEVGVCESTVWFDLNGKK